MAEQQVGLWVIGLTGFAGSGKTTIANHLVRHYGFQLVRFSDALKDLVAREFNLRREDLNDPAYKNHITPWNDRTVREILQIIGTDGFRAVDPNYWVKKAVAKVLQLHAAAPARGRFVFDDVRFANEAIAILEELGGELWGVQKVDEVGALIMPTSHHSSETAIWGSLERCDLMLLAKEGDTRELLRQATAALRPTEGAL